MKIVSPFILFACLLTTFEASGQDDRDKKRKKPERGGGREATKFLKELDTNGDGSLSWTEFSSGERAKRLDQEVRRKIFDRLDKNGDGLIGLAELAPGPRRRDHPMLRRADTDQDGRISKKEFLANPPFGKADPERLERIFKRLDQNDDGFLDRKDRPGGRRKGPPGGPPMWRFDFKKWDSNQDGVIDRKEFREVPFLREAPKSDRADLFDRIDEDGDDRISPAEMRRHREKRAPKKPRRPGRGPERPTE